MVKCGWLGKITQKKIVDKTKEMTIEEAESDLQNKILTAYSAFVRYVEFFYGTKKKIKEIEKINGEPFKKTFETLKNLRNKQDKDSKDFRLLSDSIYIFENIEDMLSAMGYYD